MIDEEARSWLRRRLSGEKMFATGAVRQVLQQWWAEQSNGMGGGVSDLFEYIGYPNEPLEQMPTIPTYYRMLQDKEWQAALQRLAGSPWGIV